MIPQLLNLGRPVKENTWLSRLQEKLVKQHERVSVFDNCVTTSRLTFLKVPNSKERRVARQDQDNG